MSTTPVIFMTDSTVCIYWKGNSYNRAREDIDSEAFSALVKEGRVDEAIAFVNPRVAVDLWLDAYPDGSVQFDGTIFCIDSKPLPVDLSDRVLELANAGLRPDSLVNFWRRLQHNPSWKCTQNLFKFLNLHKIPLDNDGFIVGYKAIRSDRTDIHSGRIKYDVGATVTEPRNYVCDDTSVGCSTGLHVGSADYALQFGGTDSVKILCRVDPADVVSIPDDCNFSKLRTCKLTVIRDWEERTAFPVVFEDRNNSEDESDDDYEDEDESDDYEDEDEDADGAEDEDHFDSPTVVPDSAPSDSSLSPRAKQLSGMNWKELRKMLIAAGHPAGHGPLATKAAMLALAIEKNL